LTSPEPGRPSASSAASLVQILLPLFDDEGRAQPRRHFAAVREELMRRFGGLTAYTRAPAEGVWAESADASPRRDDIVVYEVMTPDLDPAWWAEFRRGLEARFRQERVVVRAESIRLL
jgi:hypothetical protein